MAIDGVIRRTGAVVPQQPAVQSRPHIKIQPQPVLRGVVGMDGIRRRPIASATQAITQVAAPITASLSPAMALAPNVSAIPQPRDYDVEHTGDPRRIPWKQLIAGVTATTLIFSGALAIRHARSQSLNNTRAASSVTATPAPQPEPKNQAAIASTAAVQAAINTAVNGFASSTGVPTGVVVINLKTGVTATANPDQVFTSASLYKLFVAESVYRGIDSGAIRMSQAVSGTGRNVQDCLNLMITISDNTCGVGLGSLVGWDKQIERLHNAGFTHTLLRANDAEKTSAGDVALLLKRLYGGTLLSPSSSETFINLLKAQKVNNRLPQGLPPGTVIAHKTGDLDGVVHDAGIVYNAEGGDYIIAALTGPWSSPGTAPSAFAQLSSSIYQAMNTK